MGAKTEQLRQWYEQHANEFEHSATIQTNGLFGRLDPTEQERLNRFKLWFLEEHGFVSLRGKDVLEFGCGHGSMAIETRQYASYVGVDFVEGLVAFGRHRIAQAKLSQRVKLVHADCMEFDGGEASFDVVCAFGMFEYVEDPQATLARMVYHLRPGGTLFLNAHSSSPLYNFVRRRRHRRQMAQGGIPKQLYSASEMCSLLENVGLTDIRIWMAEFPFLGTLYARTGWPWLVTLRNAIAERPAFRFLGTDFNAIATRP